MKKYPRTAHGREARSHRDALAASPWEVRRPALRRLFEEISPTYDRLNHRLSFGLDRGWRRWAVRALEGAPPGPWCDLASGTGDLAIAMADAGRVILRADISAPLLRAGERKLLELRLPERGDGPAGPDAIAPGPLSESIATGSPALVCEMDHLPFRGGSLAGIAQGFALRHCRDFNGFFTELARVTAPGGRIALLDMRYPCRGRSAGLYRFYFRRVLPRLAALLGGERSAYEMMVDSVRGLPPEEELVRALAAAGFVEARSHRGFAGAVALLTARQP